MDRTATELFADFAAELEAGWVPGEVREAVGLHLLDALGCGLAAVANGAAPHAAAAAAGGAGAASAIGQAEPLAPEAAALVNGIRCHALDFDDTHPSSIAHVSAVVVPAALAAAEDARADGESLALALLVGNEVTCRIGRPVADRFHLRGFHPTAICGAFGATAAVARLHGLDAATTVQAFGIAGSMAAGLMAYLGDGSATKPIHPGWMAHAAFYATRLAAAGATGPAHVLEGPNGVYAAFVDRAGVRAEDVAGDLGAHWETPAIAFKPYAGCHFLHAPLDALIALRDEYGFGPEDVRRLVVRSPAAGIGLVGEPIERKRRPATAYEAKFSAPFALAAKLVLDRTDPGIFAEQHLRDPELLAVASRIDCETVEFESFPDSIPGGVRVELADGRLLQLDLPHQRGGAGDPMTAEEISEKFRAVGAPALAPGAAAELEAACLGVFELDGLRPFARLREAAELAA